MGLLLENEDGLTKDWSIIKRACTHFDKQEEWNDETSSSGQDPMERRSYELEGNLEPNKEHGGRDD